MCKKIKLPKDVEFILKKLNENEEGLVVGGSIRDLLLGLEPKDYDFATNISYEKLLGIFKEYSPKEIGKAFGIVQIKVNGVHYEIAKYRTDGKYSDMRRPDDVVFVDNYFEDAKRRDFTINAIAYDGENLIDYFNGINDLENKTIKFIGSSDNRIKEDALRMLRAVRFAHRYGFTIDGSSRYSILHNSRAITNISKERIRDEFNKMLLSDKPSDCIRILQDVDLLRYIIPELCVCIGFDQRNPHHNKNVYEHILSVLDFSKKDLVVRLSALLHDIAKPKCFSVDDNGVGHFYGHDKESGVMAENILRRLKYDNKTIERVVILVSNHMNKAHKKSNKAIKKFINRVGEDNVNDMFDLLRADILGSSSPFDFNSLDSLIKNIYRVIYSKEPTKVNDLNINGQDLIEIGFKQGKIIGEILDKCMEYVLEYPDKNDKVILIEDIVGEYIR